MIKKISTFLAPLLVVTIISVPRSGEALLPPWDEILAAEPITQFIGPDFLGQITVYTDSIKRLGLAANKTYNATQSTINNAQSAINSAMSFDFNALMSGDVSPGQMDIVDCETAKGDISIDVEDADSIINGLQKILREYHEYGADARRAQEYRVSEFYVDSIVEVYSAAKELKIYLESDVRKNIDRGILCVQGEGSDCGIPSPDALNESLYAEAKAMEQIDNLLMVIQKAIAMKAQLRAVETLRNIQPVLIESKEKSEDKTASVNLSQKQKEIQLSSTGSISYSAPLAFAQLSKDAESIIGGMQNISSSTQNAVKALLTKTQAPESTMTHAFNSIETMEKMDELNKLAPITEEVTTAQNAHNAIVNLKGYQDAAEAYKDSLAEYEKALEYLREADKCVINYLGRRFSNPSTVWYGGSISQDDVAEYDLRSGLSGWAIEAYETAKAAQTTSATTEDIAAPTIDISTDETYNDVSDSEKVLETFSKSVPENTTIGASKEEQIAEENRATDLIPWQIGSEASKLLLENPEKWGSVKQSFPIWNDVKTFYNQYLDGKYENIKARLKIYTVSDVKSLLIDVLSGKSDADKLDETPDISETSEQQEYNRLDAELTLSNLKAEEEKASELSALTATSNKTLSSLESQRASLVADIDTASAKYKRISDEINDTRTSIQENANQTVRDAVAVFPGFSSGSGSINTLETTDSMQSAIDNKIKQDTAASSLDTLEEDAKEAQREVENLQEQLKALDKKIAQQKLDSQKSQSSVISKLKAKIAANSAQAQTEKEAALSKFTQAAEKGITSIANNIVSKLIEDFALKNPGMQYTGIGAATMVASLNKIISEALDDLYAKVEKRINQARQEIESLGDKKYLNAYHEQIVEIHQRMIADIMVMPLTIKYNLMNISTTLYLYKNLATADVTAETEAYFVGSPAKERDLKAPKAMLEYNLPPLREIVHFDATDFSNAKPYDKNRTTSEPLSATDFLNYGGEVPGIWKLMLQDKPFVEKDFNLKEALNQGCSAVSFFRGGFMPCRVKGGNIVVDVSKSGNFIKSKSEGQTLYYCPYLEMRSGKVYDTMFDNEINFNQFTSIKDLINQAQEKEEIPSYNCTYSELGTLLDADDNNIISFRQTTYDAFHSLLDEDDTSEKEPSSKEKQQALIYRNAVLAKNQIGDFLTYVEYEQARRKEVEETKASYDELMADLYSMLSQFGFEPSEDFDITKQSDYNLARSKLDGVKNSKVSSALTKLNSINTENNSVVKERVDKYKGILAALQKDKDELTVISNVVTDDNSLDEELKSSKVNNTVVDKYEEDANERLKNRKNASQTPFCATY